MNYTPAPLRVQSWRKIICGGTRTKKVEYRSLEVCKLVHCARWQHCTQLRDDGHITTETHGTIAVLENLEWHCEWPRNLERCFWTGGARTPRAAWALFWSVHFFVLTKEHLYTTESLIHVGNSFLTISYNLFKSVCCGNTKDCVWKCLVTDVFQYNWGAAWKRK
jgi:hypothetical protein